MSKCINYTYLNDRDYQEQSKFDFLSCNRNSIWKDCRDFNNVQLHGHFKYTMPDQKMGTIHQKTTRLNEKAKIKRIGYYGIGKCRV